MLNYFYFSKIIFDVMLFESSHIPAIQMLVLLHLCMHSLLYTACELNACFAAVIAAFLYLPTAGELSESGVGMAWRLG